MDRLSNMARTMLSCGVRRLRMTRACGAAPYREEGERAMSKVVMTRGKFDGINACADARGVIAAAAMDQRGSLQKAIGTARGEGGKATAEDLSEFKIAVTKILTKYASAILLDPEYGLEALK